MLTTEHQEHADLAVAPERVLVRARKVLIHLTDEDEVGIETEGDQFGAPRIALAVLDAFATPRTVRDALASFAGRGAQEAFDAATCVRELVRNGILVDPEKRHALGARGWVKPAIHLIMLDDRARTGGFCDALRAIVKPDDVVVDIGTGTGVLATCAALSARVACSPSSRAASPRSHSASSTRTA